MAIEYRGTLKGDWMCYRCLKGTAPAAYILVDGGNEDDEQYVCGACALAVLEGGEPLGNLRIEAQWTGPPAEDDDEVLDLTGDEPPPTKRR
jgi:hypothetical protein